MAAADHTRIRQLTRRISVGGMLAALILLFLIVKFFTPTADLALLSLTSLAIAIAVIEIDLQTALIVYAAASLLGLAYPGLAVVYPFLVLFGPYPLIRALIDSKFTRTQALLLKLVAGNGLAILAAAIFLWSDLQQRFSQYGRWIWPAAFLVLQVALLFYDWILSLLIQLYVTRLRRS